MNNRGQAMIVAVFVIVVIALLAMLNIYMLSGGGVSAVKNLYGIQALNVAEGGIRFTIAASLAADSDWSNNTDLGPVSLIPGTFSIHYTDKNKNSCVFESTGIVSGISRVVRVNVERGGGLPSQFTDYAVYGGEGGSIGEKVTFYNRSKIIGSFYFFGPVEIAGVRPPPCQTGGVIKSTTIIPVPAIGVPNYYASWEAISTAEAINWDNTYYDNWLNVANRSTSETLSLTGSQNLDLTVLPGKTAWFRSVRMRDNSTITGPGTICATANPLGTGDFITYNNAQIIGGPVRIIARGTVTSVRLNDYTSFQSTPEIIGYDNVILDDDVKTPFGTILYSRSGGGVSRGVQTNLRAVARGLLLAPYGIVSNNNYCSIEGLSYSYDYQAYNNAVHKGGAVFLHLGNFYNDTKIITDNAVLPPTLPPGLTAEGVSSFEVSDWREIY